MTEANRWVIGDVDSNAWVESFYVSSHSLRTTGDTQWHIRKRTLAGGLRQGVEVVELCNGPMTLQVLPSRGLGVWNANYKGIRLGWDAPIRGPVHPMFVRPNDRKGIGWLAGFDEWLCRCGLTSNGPPGDDNGTPLTLHGGIANSPAHRVEVGIEASSTPTVYVTGSVEEGGLFLGRLRLTSTLRMVLGSNCLIIHDVVENLAAQSAEMQLLYHLNFGPPLLEEGSRFAAPIREMAPLTMRAAEDVDRYQTYLGPTTGFAEQVYAFQPAALENGQTLAVLHNASRNLGAALSWNVRELPCFALWKNTGALADGYVTGLEPATNFPYFKGHERQCGRVVHLPPGGRWEATWCIEALLGAEAVLGKLNMIANTQRDISPIIHRTPVFGPP